MNQLTENVGHIKDVNEEETNRNFSDKKQMRQELKLLEKELGPDSIKVAEQLFDWGWDYMAAGWLGEAENLFKKAMGKIEKYYGADYPATATVAYFMWYLYLMQDRLDESESMLLRALSVVEQLGDEILYWTIIDGLIDLARHFVGDDELEEAESILYRVLESTADHHVDSHFREYVSIAAKDWTEVHKAMKWHGEPGVHGTRKSLDPNDLSARLIEFTDAMTLLKLARKFEQEGNLEEVESSLQQAMESLRAAPHRNERQLATIATELALVKADLGKQEEARKMSTTAILAATWADVLDLGTKAQLFSKHADLLVRIGDIEGGKKASAIAAKTWERIAELRQKAWADKIRRLAEFSFQKHGAQ